MAREVELRQQIAKIQADLDYFGDVVKLERANTVTDVVEALLSGQGIAPSSLARIVDPQTLRRAEREVSLTGYPTPALRWSDPSGNEYTLLVKCSRVYVPSRNDVAALAKRDADDAS
jgi:hypothetical protein